MNSQRHLSQNDILQVLSDFDSGELEERVEIHVSDCNQCRSKLESLAAQPELWQQASALLTDNHVGETVAFSSRIRKRSDEDELSENVAGYSVKALLESPRHPEMLGRLGHYEIEREIGRGGMGVVLKAHDTELNRAVAIKMMAPHLASFGIARQRFAREARSAAAILHPNVIAIHAVTTDSKTPWLVMPYIVGPSLEQIVKQEGALDEQDLVSFAMQIAGGLAAAHSQGVVHRDIKPANVLVESGIGRVVITDFGLARAECDASMTQTGWFAGTPNFMSPEQASGKEVDPQSDLFSLGSVMYYMATGRLPFRADGPMAVLEQIRCHYPIPARSVNPRISTTVSNLIGRLLVKDPGDRIQSAVEAHELLEQYLAHLHHPETRCKPVVKAPRKTRGRNRENTGWTILATGAVIAACVVWLAMSYLGGWLNAGGPGNNGTVQSNPYSGYASEFDRIVIEYGLTEPSKFEKQMQEIGGALYGLESQITNFATEQVPVPTDPLERQMQDIESQLNELKRWEW